MISIRQLTFAYAEGLDGFVLGPINLELEPGRAYGWQGHNGSGKSTLASILAAHRSARSGAVVGLPPRILYFQQHMTANIFSDLKVGEHLALCADPIRREEILALFPLLREHADKFPDALSGGQVQRLAFSLALIRDFDLYIFDEVTNHLDQDTVALVGRTIRSVLKRQPSATVIFISHDPVFLREYTDVVCSFNEGKVSILQSELQSS
jgi:ABC-type multidrug transport system ATPase subunit